MSSQHQDLINPSLIHYSLIRFFSGSINSFAPDFVGEFCVSLTTNYLYRATGTSPGNLVEIGRLTGGSGGGSSSPQIYVGAASYSVDTTYDFGGSSPPTQTWFNAYLNTAQLGDISGASLSSDTLTLPAGKYQIRFRQDISGFGGDANWMIHSRLWNATDSSQLLAGISTQGTKNRQGRSIYLGGIISLAATKDLQIQLWLSVNGYFGYAYSSLYGQIDDSPPNFGDRPRNMLEIIKYG